MNWETILVAVITAFSTALVAIVPVFLKRRAELIQAEAELRKADSGATEVSLRTAVAMINELQEGAALLRVDVEGERVKRRELEEIFSLEREARQRLEGELALEREARRRLAEDQERTRKDLRKHKQHVLVLQQRLRAAGLDVPPLPDTEDLVEG